MRANLISGRTLLIAVFALFVLSVPTASAADHCVGSHPLCAGTPYAGTVAGLQEAVAATGDVPGEDRIFISDGNYPLTVGVGFGSPSDDLEVIGEGDATVFSVDANGITGLQAQNFGSSLLSLGNFRVRMIGWGSGTAIIARNALVHDVTFEVTATSGNVRAYQSRVAAELFDSRMVLTGAGVGAIYTEDDLEVRDVTVSSIDGNSHGIDLSDADGTLTVLRSHFYNVRDAVATDGGTLDVRDTFIALSASGSAVGISAENGNNSSSTLTLAADNVTVIGTGSNQAGIGVGGTATDTATETGIAVVTDSLLHMTGSNSKAIRCIQSGTNTSASLNTSYVAAEEGRIQRTGTCSGSDEDLVDTTADPPIFNFAAVGDYRPTAASPVVDAATPLQVVPSGATDVDGLDREVGSAVDIGAHEFQSAMKPSPIQISATPNPADVGELIDFDAVSLEPDGGAVGFDWDFGDGNTDTGNDLQHSYSGPGDYTVTVTATDNELDSSTTTHEIHISSDPPTTPTIDLDVDHTYRGEGVEFSASGSTDSNTSEITYEWTFTGGGTATSEAGEAVIGTPTLLQSPGPTIFTATVVAVGEFGEESPSVSESVTVYNRLPEITSVNVDQPVVLRSWDFGDGTPQTAYTNEFFFPHSYDTVGVKTVEVSARDGYFSQSGPDEVEDTMTRTVEVLNREPQVGAISHTGSLKVGDQQAFSVVATESEGDTLSYAWNFGDGATGLGASASHIYSAPGTYNVVVVVSDGQGASIVKQLPLTITAKRARIEMAKPTKNFKRVKLKTSDAVAVTFTVLKAKAGFKKGSRCVKKKPGTRCDLKLAGSLKKSLAKGVTNVSFNGKWRGKKLPKGSYKLVATPADGGPAVSAAFKVR
jgi:PKD repeat protein